MPRITLICKENYLKLIAAQPPSELNPQAAIVYLLELIAT